jgi:hypothetical protein
MTCALAGRPRQYHHDGNLHPRGNSAGQDGPRQYAPEGIEIYRLRLELEKLTAQRFGLGNPTPLSSLGFGLTETYLLWNGFGLLWFC